MHKRFMGFSLACVRTIAEKLIRWTPHQRIRSMLLCLCGADIGRNVRVNEIFIANIVCGFCNLKLKDDVYVGPNCMFDLTGTIEIGERTSISPSCSFLTHSDPGSAFGNKLAELYPRKIAGISIGCDSWIGAGAIILCGVRIGNRVIAGAGSVITEDVPDNSVVAGNPAVILKKIE